MKKYKGFEYEFYYSGYRIYFSERIEEYSPLAGNTLLNISQEERERKLYDMIRYRINKHLEELMK